jgi:hypothetical protein
MSPSLEALDPQFLEQVLSRMHKQPVCVQGVRTETLSPPPRATLLPTAKVSKVTVQTSLGPHAVVAKVYPRERTRDVQVLQFLSALEYLPIPRVLHVEGADAAGQSGALLEFIEGRDAFPMTPQRARAAAASLAAVHVRFWAQADRLPEVFRQRGDRPTSERIEQGIRRLLDSPQQEALLQTDVPEVLTFLMAAMRVERDFLQADGPLPETLVHGAFAASQIVFRPVDDREEAVLIGWEHARAGRGSEDLAGLVTSLDPASHEVCYSVVLMAYVEALAKANIALRLDTLQEEVDRRSALLWAVNLPQLCRLYAERRAEPRYDAWCRWFKGTAASNISRLIPLLDRHKRKMEVPDARLM